MNYILTPFFYLIFYRISMSTWWLIKEIFILTRVDTITLMVFCISTILQLVYCLVLLSVVRRYHTSRTIIQRYRTCSITELSVCIVIWLILVLYKSGEIPLFTLAGSDRIVEVLNQNKIINLITFGSLSALGTLFFFIGLLDSSSSRRKIALFLSFFTVAIFMKKSGILTWTLFYFLFQTILFQAKMASRALILITCAITFGIFTYLRTLGVGFGSIVYLIDLVGNLIYTSSSSYLNYLLIYGGIEYAEEYRQTLPDIVGPITYLFNPVFKVLTGNGIEAAIGPYVIGKIFNLSDNLFGFNPTLLVELWFLFGDVAAVIFIIPIYMGIIIISMKAIDKIYSLAQKKMHFVYFYYVYVILNFSINVQYDVLNSTKSLIFSTLMYFVLWFLLRSKLRVRF